MQMSLTAAVQVSGFKKKKVTQVHKNTVTESIVNSQVKQGWHMQKKGAE